MTYESPQSRLQRQAKENDQTNRRRQFQEALALVGRTSKDAFANDPMWERYQRSYNDLVKLAQVLLTFGDNVKIPARLEYPSAESNLVDVPAAAPKAADGLDAPGAGISKGSVHGRHPSSRAGSAVPTHNPVTGTLVY